MSFRAILDDSGAVFPTLNLMHELGVLGRFIPEFRALTCLVQYDVYHKFSADQHSLLQPKADIKDEVDSDDEEEEEDEDDDEPKLRRPAARVRPLRRGPS